ncbi:MAG: YlxM family DNA-binding protein [Fusicatenibacter sp.]|nr:YlxM family DNA-binding protein [Fusicatenibacter sp.]
MICKVIAMEKILEQTLLYDFYGELLTEHQRQIYEDVVLNDFSLSEVAANRGISRQGVHDLVKRCNKTLEEYEDKLHLVARFVQIREKINEICRLTSDPGDEPVENVMKQIAAISSDILKEL